MSWTPRFNMFSMIHKAMREMLYDAAGLLQRADFTEERSMQIILGNLETILEIFGNHADLEDEIVLQTVRPYNPGLIAVLEQEHEKDHLLSEGLRTAISEYKISVTPVERVHSGSKLFYAFNAFIAFNLDHMNKEEIELNSTLWNNYSNEELIAINGKVVSAVPPDKLIINLTWMMRSCNDFELINLIKGINKNAPNEFTARILKLAEKEIIADRWSVIFKELNIRDES